MCYKLWKGKSKINSITKSFYLGGRKSSNWCREFLHSLSHLLFQELSTNYAPGPVGIGVNKTVRNPCPQWNLFSSRVTDNMKQQIKYTLC